LGVGGRHPKNHFDISPNNHGKGFLPLRARETNRSSVLSATTVAGFPFTHALFWVFEDTDYVLECERILDVSCRHLGTLVVGSQHLGSSVQAATQHRPKVSGFACGMGGELFVPLENVRVQRNECSVEVLFRELGDVNAVGRRITDFFE